MKIALLTPSRERIFKKIELIESIKNTVDNIDNVVLYLGIDEDDPTKNEAKQLASENKFVKIIDIKNDGKFLGLGRLWNLCANNAKEDILAMIGDDMVFKTKGWDTLILNEFSDFNCPSDKIKMVYCNDGRHGKAIAVNFFIHRRYMETTGYLTREEFMVDFIDLWVQQVLSSIGRCKYVGDILIEHKHWSFRKSEKDKVANNLRGNNYPLISQKLWASLHQARIDEANLLASKTGQNVNLEFINNIIPG